MKRIPDTIKKKISKAGFVYVGTASLKGVPHLVIEKGLEVLDDQHIAFTGWFCQKGIRNLGESPKIAIALMDADGEGYQLLGDIVELKETEISESLARSRPDGDDFPKHPHLLSIKIESITALKFGVHSDRELIL